MDDIIEGVFKGLLHILGYIFRLLAWLVLEGFWQTAWYVGWPVCRVITLGKLPKEFMNQSRQVSRLTNFVVSLVGFATIILFGVLISSLLDFS